MPPRRLRLVLLCLVAAAAACGTPPDVTSVQGNAPKLDTPAFVAPVAFYNVKKIVVLRNQLRVLISDDQEACNHLFYESEEQERPYLLKTENDVTTHLPSLWLKMPDHSPVMPDMRGVGDDLEASWDPGAPPGDECDDSACASRWLTASSGTVTIEKVGDPEKSDGTARGDFYLTFDGTQISGTFKATPCPGLEVKGCSAAGGGGALAPALGLLSLLALRRRNRRSAARE